MTASLKDTPVRLVYFDDAGSSGLNLADKHQPYQIVAATLLKDGDFGISEILLGNVIDMMPEDARSSFEFHAADLWHGNKPFDKLPHDKAEEAIRECLEIAKALPLPIVYGAVDKKKLSETPYSTAEPLDIAFQLCIEGVEEWLKGNSQRDDELAIFIFDEMKNEHHKNLLRNTFRRFRRKVRSFEHRPGKLAHVVDDMFFGDSADSIGIQMTDVCAFVIERHLAGKEDTEYLYQIIKDRIYAAKVKPE
jgi:hypothetical protein